MREIYVIGSCLILAIVVQRSDALFDKKPKPPPKSSVQIGLIKPQKPGANPIAPAATQANAAKPDNLAGTTQDAGTAELTYQLDANKQRENEIKKVSQDLKQHGDHGDKKDNTSSLSETTRQLVALAKKRAKLRIALSIYGVVNCILFVISWAGRAIPPPFGTIIYVLDMLARRVAQEPLNQYYANYRDEHAEIVASYALKHRDQVPTIRVGANLPVVLPPSAGKYAGKQTFGVLKEKPGEVLPIHVRNHRIASMNPYQFFKETWTAMRM